MADHLKLPHHLDLPSKRPLRRFDPDPPPFDFSAHAKNLRGVLEGLESSTPGIFSSTVNDEVDTDPEAPYLGDVVLKFSGSAPFTSNAFNGVGMVPLAVSEEKRYFALTDSQARMAFNEYVGGFLDNPEDFTAGSQALREALKNIKGVELYNRDDRLQGLSSPIEGSVMDVDIVLWPTSIAIQRAEEEGRRRVEVLASLIAGFAGEDERVAALATSSDDPDMLLIHASLNEEAFNAIANHPYVERIRGPLSTNVTLAEIGAGGPPMEVVLPEGAAIGIIDDLVDDNNPWLDGVVVDRRSFPPDYAFGHSTTHGTQVAGIAAWGNVRNLLDPAFDGQPHPIYAARLAQMNSTFDTQVVGNPADQFRDALDWLASCGVRIVVLALGEGHADDGAIPSDLSAVVDQKIKEHGLVVVTSSGNLQVIEGHWKADYPEYLSHRSSKVAAPGTAAMAVTVASIAHTHAFDRSRWPHGTAIAPEGQTAPFSRTGPSRGTNSSGRQKPEFSAHGGSWALDQATGNLIADDAELAITTLIPPVNGRLFGSASGTSFAAPRVAHEIARIQTRYPEASGNLLRALAALAGDQRPRGMLKSGDHIAGLYGIPNADRVLDSGDNRVIFTYEGEMPTNRHAVIQVPIPKEFAYGASERELRIALAFDPPVRRSRRDYVAGRMRFDFLHRENMADIRKAYASQPTEAERRSTGTDLIKLPSGRTLEPPKSRMYTDTLVCRSYHSQSAGWDVDDENYYIVVSHDHSPWTESQKKKYTSQRFAIAVQLIDHERLDLDLYNHAAAELAVQVRGRVIN
ncbi:S8 family serine peptidase [Citricoccus parietis]|uniref:S8 family serine peptidase n=1 Tax=Citricoccus parietis TaxID=592307 RepID=A0ABV6F3V7_9MICC